MNCLEFVGRLKKVKGGSGQWTACCPAHDDSSPSLSIRDMADRILLKCHAGCTALDIVDALGLKLTDLFAESLPQNSIRWTADDAARALIQRGLRRDTLKYFRVDTDIKVQAWSFPLGKRKGKKWKSFTGKPRKYWNNKGNILSCYHLAPCAGLDEAWLVEGEPDVWIMTQANLKAFSLTAGADSINDGIVQQIREANIGIIHIVYDTDSAGKDGAEKVAKALDGADQAFTVRQLPRAVGVGGDVTTLYNNLGCDDESFRATVAALPERPVGKDTTETRNKRYQLEAIESLQAAQVITYWGWPDFDRTFGPLVRGWLYVVGARPGNGKTSILLSLLSRLREDGIPTLYFGTEMIPSDLVKKWAALRLGMNELRVFTDQLRADERKTLQTEIEYVTNSQKLTFSSSSRLDQERIAAEVAWAFDKCRGPEPLVLILDHIHQVTQEREVLETLIRELKYLATERRVAMLVASQLSRPKDAGPFDLYMPPSLSRYKGASAMEENLDVGLGLFRPLRAGLKKGDRAAVERGERAVTDLAEPNTMGVVCLKHRYGGSVAGKFVSLTMNGSRLESKAFQRPERPMDAGDAWEPEYDDADVPPF